MGAGAGTIIAGWMVGESKDYSIALHGGSALFAVAAGLILVPRGAARALP